MSALKALPELASRPCPCRVGDPRSIHCRGSLRQLRGQPDGQTDRQQAEQAPRWLRGQGLAVSLQGSLGGWTGSSRPSGLSSGAVVGFRGPGGNCRQCTWKKPARGGPRRA